MRIIINKCSNYAHTLFNIAQICSLCQAKKSKFELFLA